MHRKLLLALALTIGAMTGCGGAGYGGGYYVRTPPPPPPRYGAVGYAPGPGYVWIDGYWDRRGSQWYWSNGSWMRPPRPRAVWVPHNWRRHGDGYRFYRGHWR